MIGPGWAACHQAARPAATEAVHLPRLQVDSCGRVALSNRHGDRVLVAHHDLPRLAVMLGDAWWAGLHTGSEAWSDLRVAAARAVGDSWDPAR